MMAISQRLWRRVDKSQSCWLWTGSLNQDGYGRISLGARGSGVTSTHRLSWELHYGAVPIGKNVCHSCDVRNCVNPAHLFLASQAENVADMYSKGRNNNVGPLPQRARSARLSPEVVASIRRSSSSVATAKRFGISYRHLRQIMTGVRWAAQL
jgi:hypothetical protein